MKFKVGDKVLMVNSISDHTEYEDGYSDHIEAKEKKFIGIIESVRRNNYSCTWFTKSGMNHSSLISENQLIHLKQTINPNFKSYVKMEQEKCAN